MVFRKSAMAARRPQIIRPTMKAAGRVVHPGVTRVPPWLSGGRAGKGAGGKGGQQGGWVFVPAGAPMPTVAGGWATGGKGNRRFGKGGVQAPMTKSEKEHEKNKDKMGKLDNELKVWVGGLKKDTTRGLLFKHFRELDCKPKLCEMMGKTTACLSYPTAEEASSAIAIVNGTDMDGTTLEVDVWTQKEKGEKRERRPKKSEATEGEDGEKKKKKKGGSIAKKQAKNEQRMAKKIEGIDDDLKIKITGLKLSCDWKKVKEHFTDNGVEVELCNIMKPGVAAVTFKEATDASSAIDIMNDTECDGKKIKVAAWS